MTCGTKTCFKCGKPAETFVCGEFFAATESPTHDGRFWVCWKCQGALFRAAYGWPFGKHAVAPALGIAPEWARAQAPLGSWEEKKTK